MSRLTTAQVISLGQYLEPEFDPTSLTISQLLGILGYHNIKYPTPYSKPKLIQIFNDEIKPRSAKFKKEHLKKENSIASDEGITDGVTGKPLATARQTLPVRRSSRRLSQTPNQVIGPSAVSNESPKRRRSSAQPALAGPSRRAAAKHAALIEESESEDTSAVRVAPNNEAERAGLGRGRISQALAEDSGWEDNNIFQSGAEDSSPMRPSPARVKSGRKITRRKSRTSSSAPPQILPSSSPMKLAHDVPRPTFEREHEISFWASDDSPMAQPGPSSTDPRDRKNLGMDEEEGNDDIALQGPRAQIPGSGERKLTLPAKKVVSSPPWSLVATRVLVFLLFSAASAVILQYKAASASIGYCKRGTNSNEYLDASSNVTIPCNWVNAISSYMTSNDESATADGELLQKITSSLCLPRPDQCTPCPEHATCDQFSLVCDTGYVLRSHPLLGFLSAVPSRTKASLTPSTPILDLVWKVISIALDGLPGLGSVSFPPRCREDPKRKRNIGALGKALEALLGQERGKRLCTGGKILTMAVKPEDGGDAKKWGVELGQLRETMRKKTSPHLLASFDDTFKEAIQQLIQWGNVVIGEDEEGKRYLAHGTPDLTLACSLIVKSRAVWARWRVTVLGLVLMILLVIIVRGQRAQRRIETKRIAELVQTALNLLRSQERAHHIDPITSPQPYLSSLQLRDLILQDEHSIPMRKRLWDQVERIVEENANVRVNLQEVGGGDEMRVWRWVGNAGQNEGARTELETGS